MKHNTTSRRYHLIQKYLLLPALFLLGLTSLVAQDAVVSNVKAQQLPGTKLVEITYDLNVFSGNSAYVRVEISETGNGVYNLPLHTLTGDGVNQPSGSGTGKKIVWNAGADWDGNFTNQAVAKVSVLPSAPSGFAMIPVGNFVMGDQSVTQEGQSDELPTRTVYVSAFYMAKTEVTKTQWDEVATWAANNGYDITAAGGEGKAGMHPVQNVSWYECVKWCNAKSEMEGRTPVYTYFTGTLPNLTIHTYKTGEQSPDVNYNCNGYRLPTEAEWEKAARGGLIGKRFPWGDTISHSLANYNSSSLYSYDISPTSSYHPIYWDDRDTPGILNLPYTSPVGSFAANGYGLFDMCGNVQEWCYDRYGSSYYGNNGNTSDPTGASSGSPRVYRGGSWFSFTSHERCAKRNRLNPTGTNYTIGFRLSLLVQ